MKLKKALAAGLTTVVLISSCLNVSAAPKTANNLTNSLTLEEINSLILNVEAYKQAYPDLEAAFGNDANAYINHYLTTGVYEGRTKGVLFDPLTYAEAYTDIRNALGYDIIAIVNHYVTYGIAENRTMGTSYGYADIAAAENAGLNRYYIPRELASEYKDISYDGSFSGSPLTSDNNTANTGSTAGSNSGNFTFAANNSSTANVDTAADRWNYHHTTSIYHDDGTLWRVEYYDENNKLQEWSDVTNVNPDTNSYTENIYSYDAENDEIILERTDTYENGVLQSSVSGTN